MAELLDENRTTYLAWEKKKIPEAHILRRISVILGVSMEDLLGPDDERPDLEEHNPGLKAIIKKPVDEYKEKYLSLLERYHALFDLATNSGLVPPSPPPLAVEKSYTQQSRPAIPGAGTIIPANREEQIDGLGKLLKVKREKKKDKPDDSPSIRD